jgi:opacity protein-like surface antigen
VNRIILSILTTLLFSTGTFAQLNWETVHTGEFGATLGGAHYFGDLNTRASFNRPKPAIGVFFRKQFGNYVALRLAGHFAQVGYTDTYSKNEFQRLRNLSFNSKIYEVTLQGDFNFFKFIPELPEHNFTPYITIGIGVMNFDPYAYLDGQKYNLRQLGTEGQTKGYLGRTPYSTTALVIPFGAGLKYNLTERTNISFEIAHRFTSTDYLDDVSKTYVPLNILDPGPNGTLSEAQLLSDRSYEINDKPFFQAGQQRGFSKQRDQYIIGEVGISFNLSRYRCPTAN